MFRAESDNTLFFLGKHYTFSEEHKSILLQLAQASPSGTSRICLHESQSHSTQSMIICILGNKCFIPHYHPASKSESYTIIRGKLYVDIMSSDGFILQTHCLTRENTPYMHKGLTPHKTYTLDSYAVFHEVYHGTFSREYDVHEFNQINQINEINDK